MNLFFLRHLDTNSDCLFSSNSGSSLMIFNCSLRHKSQFLEPHLYGKAYAAMFHLISYRISSLVSFPMYLESSLSVEYLLCLYVLVWLLNLVLSFPSDVPQCSSRLSVVVTSALYTLHLAKHLPAKGQLALYLQLHNLAGFFSSIKTLALCCFIKLCKLAIEL